MPRYKLTLEYDGTPFVGWQAQGGEVSVQGALERALEACGNGPTRVQGAGRTDAGVHASGQVAHCDMLKDWMPERLTGALNAHLRPHPIVVLGTSRVADDFHARFDAVHRVYRYRILNRRVGPALERDRVWWVARTLDAEAMHEGARALVGRHDFTTFRASACQARSPVKTLDRLAVWREGAHILIEAEARSFLHNQIRSIAGSLKCVGEGTWSAGEMARVLAARERAACGPLAPPGGLYLMRVDYPGEGQNPRPAAPEAPIARG